MRQLMWEPLGFGRRRTLLRAGDDCGGAYLLCVHPRWFAAPVGATCRTCRTHWLYRPGQRRTPTHAECSPSRYQLCICRHRAPQPEIRICEYSADVGVQYPSGGEAKSPPRRFRGAGKSTRSNFTVPPGLMNP